MSSLVVYEQKSSLYIDLRARVSETHGAVLQGFRRREDGTAAVAEREGAVRVGDALVAVNGADIAHAPFLDVIRMLQSCTWPLELRFEDAASLGGEGDGGGRGGGGGEGEGGEGGEEAVHDGGGGGGARARSRSRGWSRTVGAVRLGVSAARAVTTSSRSAVSGGASRLRTTASSGGSAVGSAVSRGAGKALRGIKGVKGLRNVNFAPSSSAARNASAEERQQLQFLVQLLSSARLVPCGEVLDGMEMARAHRRAPPADEEQPHSHADVVCVVFGELTLGAAEAEFDARFGSGAEAQGGCGVGGLRARLRLAWFRGTDDGKCVEIAGVTGGLYQPSVNDIGATVCLQCALVDDPSVVNFLEYGPVLADASVVERARELLQVARADSGGGGDGGDSSEGVRFAVTHRAWPERRHALMATAHGLRLLCVGGTAEHESGDGGAAAAGSDQEVVLWEAAYHPTLLLLLDPCCPGFLHVVHSPASRCSPLAAPAARDRDVLALVVRELRDAAVGREGALAAAAAEREVSLEELEQEEKDRAFPGDEDAAREWAGQWDADDGDSEGEGEGAAVGDAVASEEARLRAAAVSEEDHDEGAAVPSLLPPPLPPPPPPAPPPPAPVSSAPAAAAAIGADAADDFGRQLRAAETQLLSSRREASRLARDLNAARQRQRALATRWDATERVRQRAVTELGVATSERSALRRRVEEQALELAQTHDALSSARGTSGTQEAELLEAQAELRSARHEMLGLVEALQATQVQLVEARRRSAGSDAVGVAVAEADAALQAAAEARAAAEAEADALRAELAQRASAAEMGDATGAADLKRTADALAAARRDAEKEAELAARAAADKEGELATLRAEVAAAVQGQHGSLQVAQAAQVRADALQVELGQVRVDLAAAKADRREAKAAVAAARGAAARDARGDAEADAAIAIAAAQRESADARAALESAEAERRGLRRKLDSLMKDLARLGTPEEIDRQLRERRSLQAELADAHAHRRAERRTAAAEIARYRAALEEALSEMHKSGAEVLLDRASVSFRQLTASLGAGGGDGVGSELGARAPSGGSAAAERRVGGELRVKVCAGADAYSIACEGDHPVSWLLSEVIRRRMEDKQLDDAGILGLERLQQGGGRGVALDLAANIGSCVVDGEVLRATIAHRIYS